MSDWRRKRANEQRKCRTICAGEGEAGAVSLRVKSLADLPARYQVVPGCVTSGPTVKTVTSKYRNTPTVEDGQRFDSKLEVRCYRELMLRKAAGEIWFFLRQVAFPLEGDVKYRCDFFVVLAGGGIEVIDAKGKDTRASINKRKQVKARYGVEVKLWTGAVGAITTREV